LGTVELAGVTAIEVSVAGAAVSTVLPTTAPWVAEMVEVPLAATAVAEPAVPIVAVAVLDEDHMTDEVMSAVEASL